MYLEDLGVRLSAQESYVWSSFIPLRIYLKMSDCTVISSYLMLYEL